MKSLRVFHPDDMQGQHTHLSIMILTKHKSLLPGWKHDGTFWHNKPGTGKIAIPTPDVVSFFYTGELMELMKI